MSMSNFLDRFDLDITLRDAALDPDNRPTRRMIANAAIGMDALDAYYAVREIREAAQWIHEGLAQGKRKLASLLSNPQADDFQRKRPPGTIGGRKAPLCRRCALRLAWLDGSHIDHQNRRSFPRSPFRSIGGSDSAGWCRAATGE